MYKKILVPYDKSEPARHALEQALELVKDVDGAEVTVLNVVDWRDYNAETFKIASRMSGGGIGLQAVEMFDMDYFGFLGQPEAKTFGAGSWAITIDL